MSTLRHRRGEEVATGTCDHMQANPRLSGHRPGEEVATGTCKPTLDSLCVDDNRRSGEYTCTLPIGIIMTLSFFFFFFKQLIQRVVRELY